MDPRDVATGRAQHLERGDPRPTRFEPRAHAVGDADSGNRQRGQRDQRQKLPHPADEPVEPRTGAAAVAQLPPGIGEIALELCCRGERIGSGGHPHAGFAAVHAARLDQSAGGERRVARDHHRAEGEAFTKAVGLVGDDAADGQLDRADLELVAARDVQPVGDPAGDPCGGAGGRADLAPVRERQCAIERPGSVDRLEFDRDGGVGITVGNRHRLKPRPGGDGAERF